MSNDIQQARTLLPLPELMDVLGFGHCCAKSARCPFHDDHNPSFSVYESSGRWFWKCFARCGAGDEVAFLQIAEGLSHAEARKKFVRLAATVGTEERIVKTDYTLHWSQCVEAVTEHAMDELSTWRGYSLPFCQWLKQERLIGIRNRNWAFPIRVDDETVVGIHYRLADGTWLVEGGCGMLPLTIGDTTVARYVFVFESQWDALAFLDRIGLYQDAGPCAILITRGATNGKLIHGLCSADATVLAFMQNDLPKQDGTKPGEMWLRDITAHAGCEVRNVPMQGQFKDLNEWTLAGASGSDIMDALGRATLCAQPNDGVANAPDTSRPRIELPGNDRLLSDFAADVGRLLHGENIYRHGNEVVQIRGNEDGVEAIPPHRFRTLIERFLICYKRQPLTMGVLTFARTMTAEDARGVLASTQFQQELRTLVRVNPVMLPVMRTSGIIELLSEGYDSESGVFTRSCGIRYDESMSREAAKGILDRLLAEFCFADAGRSKAVEISAMLTLFCLGLLPDKGVRPCFIFFANAEGAGKTLLAICAIVPIFGSAPTAAIPADENEIRKVLLCAVREASLVILFDNVKDHLSSGALEGFLTSTDWRDRVLGHSSSFTGPNNATVFVTGNNCTVSPDMRRRSLFCELFLEADRPEDRVFKRKLDAATVLQMRGEILSALWALVKSWARAGRPKCSRTNPAFPGWSEIIGGIVEHAGFACPLEPLPVGSPVDQNLADISALVRVLGTSPGHQYAFDKLLDTACGQGLFENLIGTEKQVIDRSQRSKLASLLKRYDHRVFGKEWRFVIIGAGHARRYMAERLQDS